VKPVSEHLVGNDAHAPCFHCVDQEGLFALQGKNAYLEKRRPDFSRFPRLP
jgi:1,4-dihydroxy-2-naphthoyl-CoA synthase